MVSGNTYTLRECNDCGLIITSDAPCQEEIGDYYKTDSYISHTDTRQGLMNRLYHLARRIMLGRKRRRFEKLDLPSRNLLDIGAGTGYFANHMQENGWQVSAIEPDADARIFMKKTFGIAAMDTDAIYEMEPNSFSVISMWHVLEHVYDPADYLVNINRLLRREGYLVMALPNPLCADAHIQSMEWSAWDVPRHLWHFPPAAVNMLLGKHGFSLQSIHIMPFDPFYNAIKTYVLRGDKLAYIKGFLVGMYAYMVSLFRREKASSLIYIARKTA